MTEPLPIGDFTANFNPNPMVVKHGRGPKGTKCKTCRFCYRRDYHSRTYFKCYRRGETRGAGTDHRLKWDACRIYNTEEPEDEEKGGGT